MAHPAGTRAVTPACTGRGSAGGAGGARGSSTRGADRVPPWQAVPAVFVHGVPDTHRLWTPVIERLDRADVRALDLPGFGSPTPEGFGATKEEYLAWLVGAVEALGEPVDLVGHDWGAILGARLVVTRPDLVRTWAVGGGLIHRDCEWHAFAVTWQTPRDGEAMMEGLTPQAMIAVGPALGLPAEYLTEAAPQVDGIMKDSILALYRSSVEMPREWFGDWGAAPAPGLVIWGADDPFVSSDFAARVADEAGADALVFDDCGHYWPLERSDEVAGALQQLWSRG